MHLHTSARENQRQCTALYLSSTYSQILVAFWSTLTAGNQGNLFFSGQNPPVFLYNPPVMGIWWLMIIVHFLHWQFSWGYRSKSLKNDSCVIACSPSCWDSAELAAYLNTTKAAKHQKDTKTPLKSIQFVHHNSFSLELLKIVRNVFVNSNKAEK